MKKNEMPTYAKRRFNGKAEFVRFRRERGCDFQWSVLLRATRNFRAWKKVCDQKTASGYSRRYVVIALTIPKGAQFWTHLSEMKCRADMAVARGHGVSTHVVKHGGKPFVYAPGKTVLPSKRFDMTGEVCASGIHFFPSEASARKYNWN